MEQTETGKQDPTNRVRMDAAPELARLLEQRLLLPSDRVLCYGCGRGADVAWLRARKLRAQGYDPYPPFGYAEVPTGTFDVVLLVYLLTRLKTDENRREVLGKAFQHVRPGGRLMVVSRNWQRLAARAGHRDRENAMAYLAGLLDACSANEIRTHACDAESGTLCLSAWRAGGTRPRRAVEFIDTVEGVQAACAALAREPYVGLDVETTLEEPRDICLVQLGAPDRTYVLDTVTVSDMSPIKELLENPNIAKIIHNAAFEEESFARYGVKIRNVFDTLPASRKKHRKSNLEGGHKLNEVCERELGLYLDKSMQTSDWTRRPLTEQQLNYAALDAEVLIDLYRIFNPPPPPETLSLF